MPLNRPRQRQALGVAPHGGELFGAVAVVDAAHLLLNDRAFVQVAGHVVGRGADELDAPLKSLVIRPRAFEAGQEAVVDVDGAAGELVAKRGC